MLSSLHDSSSRGDTSSPTSPPSQPPYITTTPQQQQQHQQPRSGNTDDVEDLTTSSQEAAHLSSSIVIEVAHLDRIVTPMGAAQQLVSSSPTTGPLGRSYKQQQSPPLCAPCITVASPFGEESSVSTDEEEDEEEFDLSLIAQAAVSAMITKSREEQQQQQQQQNRDSPTTNNHYDDYDPVVYKPLGDQDEEGPLCVTKQEIEVEPTSPLFAQPVESLGGGSQKDDATTDPTSTSLAPPQSDDGALSGGGASLGGCNGLNVVAVPSHIINTYSNSPYHPVSGGVVVGVGGSSSNESPILSYSSGHGGGGGAAASSPPTTLSSGATKPSWVDFGFVAPDLMTRSASLQGGGGCGGGGGGGGSAARSQSKVHRQQSIHALSLQLQPTTSGSYAASVSECGGGGGGGTSLTIRPETSSTTTGLEDLLNTASELFGTGSLWHQQQTTSTSTAPGVTSMSSLSLSLMTPSSSMPAAIRYLQQVVADSPSISASVLNMATGNHRVLPGLEHLVRTFGHQSNSFSDSAAAGTVSPTSSPGGVDTTHKDVVTPPPSLIYLSRYQSPAASRQDHHPPSSPNSTPSRGKLGTYPTHTFGNGGQIRQDQLTASMQEMFPPISKLDDDEPLLAGSMSGGLHQQRHHHYHHPHHMGGGVLAAATSEEREMVLSNLTVFPTSESQMLFSASLNNGPLSPGSGSERDSLIQFGDHRSGGDGGVKNISSLKMGIPTGSNSSPMSTHQQYPLNDAPPYIYNSTELSSHDTTTTTSYYNNHQHQHHYYNRHSSSNNNNHSNWTPIMTADTASPTAATPTTAPPSAIHFDASAHMACFAPIFDLSDTGDGNNNTNTQQHVTSSPPPAAKGSRVEYPKEGIDGMVESCISQSPHPHPHADLPSPSYSHTAPHCSSSLQPSSSDSQQRAHRLANAASAATSHPAIHVTTNSRPSNPLHADYSATSTTSTTSASESFSSTGSHKGDGNAFGGRLLGIQGHNSYSLNSAECLASANRRRQSSKGTPSTRIPTSSPSTSTSAPLGGSGPVVDVHRSTSSFTSSLAPPPFLQFGKTPPPGDDCSSPLDIPTVTTPNPDGSSGDIKLDSTFGQVQTVGSDAHSSFVDDDGFVATVLGRFADDRGGGLLGGGLAPVLGLGGVYHSSSSIINDNNNIHTGTDTTTRNGNQQHQPDTLMSTSQFNPLIADLSSDSIRQFPSAATLAPALHPNSPSLGARSAPSQVLSTSGLIKVAVHPLSPSAYDSRVVLFEPSINTTTSSPHNQHHQHHQQSTEELSQFFISPYSHLQSPLTHSLAPCTVLAGSGSETVGTYTPTSNSLLCGSSILGPWADVVALPPAASPISRRTPATTTTPNTAASTSISTTTTTTAAMVVAASISGGGGVDGVGGGVSGPTLKAISPIHRRREDSSGSSHTIVCTLFLRGLCDSLLRAAAQINDGTLSPTAVTYPPTDRPLIIPANTSNNEEGLVKALPLSPDCDEPTPSPRDIVSSTSNVPQMGGDENSSSNDDVPTPYDETNNNNKDNIHQHDGGDENSSSSSSSNICVRRDGGAGSGDDLVPTMDDHPSTTQSPSKRRQVSAWILEVLGASLEHFLQQHNNINPTDSIVDSIAS